MTFPTDVVSDKLRTEMRAETILADAVAIKPQIKRQDISGITLTADNEGLRNEILKSLLDLQRHESGTGIDSFLLKFSLNPGDRLMASMLKAIVDQNKIIIRQNELLRRAIESKNTIDE